MIYLLFKIFFWIVIIGGIILCPIICKAISKAVDESSGDNSFLGL